MTAIETVGLSKDYGDVKALQNLNLVVQSGAVFGFLGRNGAGKTTTIRLLTGLARPTAGRAWVGGVETTRADSVARHAFGYLPQQPAFYKWMSAREFLLYAGRLFEMASDDLGKRADEVLELVDLQKAARRKIGGFSGGMLQRLGLAQALIHRPAVLILDEPLSALDPAGRHEVINLLGALRSEATIFLSSHILADVERLCDTIGIIHEGVLLLVAGREELLADYPHNTVELEVRREQLPSVTPFLDALANYSWLAGVTQDETRVRITVKDVQQADQELLPAIVAHKLQLARYEWVRPSLEDIFLQVSQ
jgi:ABC-2 type transport system ATP-binding protein